MMYVKILAAVSVVIAAAWLIAKPNYDSGFALAGALSALIGCFVVERRRDNRLSQRQQISGPAVGIQAGGDVNVSNLSVKRNVK